MMSRPRGRDKTRAANGARGRGCAVQACRRPCGGATAGGRRARRPRCASVETTAPVRCSIVRLVGGCLWWLVAWPLVEEERYHTPECHPTPQAHSNGSSVRWCIWNENRCAWLRLVDLIKPFPTWIFFFREGKTLIFYTHTPSDKEFFLGDMGTCFTEKAVGVFVSLI